MKKPGLTTWIIIAMLSGITVGLIIHFTAGVYWVEHFSDGMSILTDIFLTANKNDYCTACFFNPGNRYCQIG